MLTVIYTLMIAVEISSQTAQRAESLGLRTRFSMRLETCWRQVRRYQRQRPVIFIRIL